MFSKFLKDDHKLIASSITKLLLEKKGTMTVDQICKHLKDVDSTDINTVIERYKDNFAVFQQPLVKLTTKIGICKTHCAKGKTCSDLNPDCKGLHICKFHFLSSKCAYGKKCTFGHDLSTEHNIKILRENLLVDITVDNLRYLLACAENRTSLTVPRICKFYNVDKDKCKYTKSRSACPDIHICRYFVSGSCIFGTKCHRSHGILDQGNIEILRKHGIDVNRTEQDIIKDLRNVLFRGTENDIITRSKLKSEPESCPPCENVSELAHPIELEEESVRTEECVQETLFGQQLHVHLVADIVQFRYLSEIHALERKSESREGIQDIQSRSSLADVSLGSYNGYATTIVYCVDCDEKVHPFYLQGENCKDGVFTKSSKFEKETTLSLQGVFVCTPKITDYQARISSTVSSLSVVGIKDVQKCDEKTVDKHLVYLKFVVILDNSKRMSVKSAPLKNKKKSKLTTGQEKNVRTRSEKRAAADKSEGNGAKRRRNRSSTYTKDGDQVFFQRFYSRQDKEHPWGNFIDTSGHQESALTWKAQGDALHSVCMICYPGGCATGFRVGKNYIMTAAHVYDNILKSEISTVGGTLRNALNNANVFAVFDYLKEGEQSVKNKFRFKNHIHFINLETDTVVLELQERRRGTMPPPLEFFKEADYTEAFFFVGHSEGKPLAINKVDKIVDMHGNEAKQDIVNIRRLSIEHTESEDHPRGRAYEFEPYLTLENQHRYLFHCKFTQGASGSPGLVFLNDGRTVVVSMLLCGYPVWYYDPNMEPFRENWSRNGKCVEQGVNFASVYAVMSKENPTLCHNIFGKS